MNNPIRFHRDGMFGVTCGLDNTLTIGTPENNRNKATNTSHLRKAFTDVDMDDLCCGTAKQLHQIDTITVVQLVHHKAPSAEALDAENHVEHPNVGTGRTVRAHPSRIVGSKQVLSSLHPAWNNPASCMHSGGEPCVCPP